MNVISPRAARTVEASALHRKRLLALAAMAVLGSGQYAIGATTRTWDRGSGTDIWSSANNWSGDVEPTNADPVLFPSFIPPGTGSIALSTNEQCDNITFNNTYSLGGGNLRLFGAGGTITVASGATATITSPIIGSVGLTKAGTGTLTLSTVGNNTFTGDVNVTGTLSVTKDSCFGNAANNVLLGPGVTTGTLVTTISFTTARDISPGILGATISANSGTNLTINGVLGGLSNPLTFAGLGTVNLGANSTRSGSTTIQNGTVRITVGGALGTGGSNLTNATLELGSTSTHGNFISLKSGGRLRTSVTGAVHSGTISVDPSVTVTLNAGDLSTDTLQLGGPGTNQYTGGTGSTTIVNGQGTITMLTASNDYAGNWQIDSGTLRPLTGFTLGSGTSAVVVNNTGTLLLNSATLNRDVTLNNGSTLAFQSVAQSYGKDTIAAAASVTLACRGAGTYTIGDAANDLTGGTGATINVTSDTLGNKIEMYNANNYAGNWAIGNLATVRVGHADALGTSTAPVVLTGSATLEVFGVTLNRAVDLNNGTTLAFANGAESFGTHTIGTSDAVAFVLKGAANGTLGNAGNDLTGGSGSTITVTSETAGNTLLLNQSSNYVGNWAIGNLATVRVGHASALGSGSTAVNSGGKLEINNVALDRILTLNNSAALAGIGAGAQSNGTVTVSGTADVFLGTGTSPTDIFTLGDGTNDLTGGAAGSSITVNGAGKVVLTQDSNYIGDWITSSGTLQISANAQLGALGNTVTLPTGGTLATTATFSSARTVTPTGGTISPASATTLTLSTALPAGSGALTKAGLGTLVLSATSTRTGTTDINAGVVRISGTASGLGTGRVTVNNTGTLELAGVTYTNALGITLNDGGTLKATGTSTFSHASGDPQVTNALANVFMNMPAAADRLTITSSIRSVNAAASSATIHVNGAGSLVLASGGISATDIFGGSWEQSGGILQVGQSFASSINALGFKNGDAKQANTITVNGGTLAVGVLGSGTGTPAWLRANVILAGGNIASTNGVDAQYGGNFTTTTATTSKVLLFDPASTSTPRDVNLVAGAAGVNNNAATTHWAGTLILDPGTTSGGDFTINRTGGTILVDPGATIQVNAGATLNLDGVDALSDGVDRVNVVNNSTTSFNVGAGFYNVGNVDGSGKTVVGSGGAILTAARVRQSMLVLTDDAALWVRPSGGANSATSVLGSTPNLGAFAQLDLADNKLIVKGSTFNAINNLVLIGRNSGDWTGLGGIVTQMSAAQPASSLTTLAVATAGDVSKTTFGGQLVIASDVLVMYTYIGDADLSGNIDGDDFARIDAGYSGSLTGYINGDFNYSGNVDADDYWLIDRNYSRNLPPLSPGLPAGVTSVPEPIYTISLFALAFLRRRSRREVY